MSKPATALSNAEFLLAKFWKAADKDAAFAQYLYGKVKERIQSGRSMDCDEYQALCSLSAPPAHCDWRHDCHAPLCDCGFNLDPDATLPLEGGR